MNFEEMKKSIRDCKKSIDFIQNEKKWKNKIQNDWFHWYNNDKSEHAKPILLPAEWIDSNVQICAINKSHYEG